MDRDAQSRDAINHAWPASFWHVLDGDKVQCDLCPHFCRLKPDQRGLCFVRGNVGGEMVLTSYGRSSGYCIDPIEKKPLNHFYPGSSVLSFGTAGCNLACKFCQNWDISKSREIDTLADAASPELIARAAAQLGCQSVAYTYNDPIIFHEYAIDVAQACARRGIKSVAVSAGYVCEKPREEFYRHMDAANIDLKSINETFYHKLTGGHLQTVLETIEYIKHETKTWLELTTLLIPGENDSDDELHQLSEWIIDHLGDDVPLHFSAFHPDFKMLDTPATPFSTLQRAREIALEHGLHYVYTGNVHDKAGESSYCHHCHNLLIGRDWYQLSEWNLTAEGACRFCGTRCAGHFADSPGQWGAKRQPVNLRDFSSDIE